VVRVTQANPYLEAKNAITYNVVALSDGYRIEVVLPRRGVSSEDKLRLIEWLRAYRSQVRKMNPLWTASFRACENGYSLEMKPAAGPKELAEEGERVKHLWNESFKYA
jgi:hypothetical protein